MLRTVSLLNSNTHIISLYAALIWLAIEIIAEVTSLLTSQEYECTVITAELPKPETCFMYNPRNGMAAEVNNASLLSRLNS